MKNKKIKIYLINIIIPLIIGLLIYLLLRENTYLSGYIRKYDKFNIIIALRNIMTFPDNIFIYYIKYNFIDSLWSYSLVWSVFISLKRKTKLSLLITCLFSVVFGITIEIFQFLQIIKGTFDFIDIASYLFAIVFAFLFIKRTERI